MLSTEIKSIFLPFCATENGEVSPACDVALDLAQKSAAHLTARALAIKFEAPFTMVPGLVGSLVGGTNVDERARTETAFKSLNTRLHAMSISSDASLLQDRTGDLLRETSALGRLNDIVILDDSKGSIMLGRAMIEEALFNTGRPVMVVPQTARTFSANRIMVAWDSSHRAARALSDAMPFLKSAEHVEIVCVTNEKELERSIPGSEIMPHLTRHGVRATVVDLTPEDRDAANSLKAHAISTHADMIVMGAYARSWLRQMVWGGVTNLMLEEAPVPVLMSH